MISFIHTADIHFGMENYGRIDPLTGIHSRLLDFEKSLNFCIDFAIEQNVDFFLFAGDAYKTATPTPTQQRLLLRCFLRLYQAGIPIIIVVGNHDNPMSFGKANALEIFGQIPITGFHVVSKPSIINLNTKSGIVQIVGIPWPTKSYANLSNDNLCSNSIELTQKISKNIASMIKDFAQKLDPLSPAILAGHLTVANGIFSGSEKRAIYGNDPVLFPSDLAIKPFDYVALGHLHRFQNLNDNGYPPIIYSGSIERVDFGERKEDKGFCHVKIFEKEKVEYDFIKTPIRKFIQLEVDVDPLRNQTDQLIESINNQDIADAVLKIIYRLPPGYKDKVDSNLVQQACQRAMYVAGLLPIVNFNSRQMRAELKVDMNTINLLDKYFDSKKETIKNKDKLLALASQIEAECDSEC